MNCPLCQHEEEVTMTCDGCGEEVCEDCYHDGAGCCDKCYEEATWCAKCGEWIDWGKVTATLCDDCEEVKQQEEEGKIAELEDLNAAIDRLKERGDIDEEQEELIRHNFQHDGRASRNLWAAVFEGGDWEGLLEAIGVAHDRHNNSEYDNIDKSGMSEEQVASLRKQMR